MGTDLTVVNAARISFFDESAQLTDKDKKLMNYLAKNKHWTPFEHNVLSVIVECPLAIRSQIHRHRTFSYNEVSRRYTSENIEFFEVKEGDFRAQDKKARQCSDGLIPKEDQVIAAMITEDLEEESRKVYHRLLELNVAREQARYWLPQHLMTKFYMTGNLRNWAAFLSLRLDQHAQQEVREVGLQIKAIIEERFPEAYNVIMKYLIKMDFDVWVDTHFANSNVNPETLKKAYEAL